MFSEGLCVKEIAFNLKLSPKTVEFHRGTICEKLGTSNLVAIANAVRSRKIIPQLKCAGCGKVMDGVTKDGRFCGHRKFHDALCRCRHWKRTHRAQLNVYERKKWAKLSVEVRRSKWRERYRKYHQSETLNSQK